MPYCVAAGVLAHLLPVEAGKSPETLRGHTLSAVARTDTDIAVLIRRSLEAVGRTAGTVSTAFTDGCSGLRSILAEAGVMKPPIADWFHIAMRLQHARQAASGLSTDEPGRIQAKTAIVAEVERLHWRIWNGKARNAQLTLERIRKVMHVFKGERGHRMTGKAQQMRWSRRGADLLLQVRCAIYNGSLGSGFGHLFEPVSTSGLPLAKAA